MIPTARDDSDRACEQSASRSGSRGESLDRKPSPARWPWHSGHDRVPGRSARATARSHWWADRGCQSEVKLAGQSRWSPRWPEPSRKFWNHCKTRLRSSQSACGNSPQFSSTYVTCSSRSPTNGATRRAASPITPLIGEILRHNNGAEAICLVSFNYDLLLDRALESFDYQPQRPADQFRSHTVLKLFKPHGSVNWARSYSSLLASTVY